MHGKWWTDPAQSCTMGTGGGGQAGIRFVVELALAA
jgi:hypothetical protein